MTQPVDSTGVVTAPVTPAAGARADAPVDPAIAEAARGFEGIFMSFLVEEMMKGTSLASANPLYAGLMTEKLGDSLADAGGIGLAAMLEQRLSAGAA